MTSFFVDTFSVGTGSAAYLDPGSDNVLTQTCSPRLRLHLKLLSTLNLKTFDTVSDLQTPMISMSHHVTTQSLGHSLITKNRQTRRSPLVDDERVWDRRYIVTSHGAVFVGGEALGEIDREVLRLVAVAVELSLAMVELGLSVLEMELAEWRYS